MTSSIFRCAAAKSRTVVLALVATAGAGCVATAPHAPPAPTLQLLGSADLSLPATCAPIPGAIYRTLFDVQPDGRVTTATSEGADGCVQQALRTWVSTFSYAPLSTVTPVAFDWMAVTASRSN